MHEIVKKEIDWLDSIPENWTVIRNKSIFKNVSIRNHGDSEVLSLYRDLGVVPKNSRDDNHNVTSLDTDGYKFVEKGDLVINKMKAWSGSVAISDYEGIVSPAYYICKVDYSLVEQRFIHHYLRNPGIVEAYEMYSAGMRIGQWDLSIDDFLKIMVAIPNKTVQKNIAKTLDNKLNQVDALISNQEAQIEKLKAYKQSLITEVVTKGLNPNVSLKSSGIEWIGDIPNHWNIVRLKHLYDYSNGSPVRVGPFGSALPSSEIIDEGVWVYNQRSVLDNNFETNNTFISEEKAKELVGFSVFPGDILITTRGSIGKTAIVPIGAPNGVLHPCVIRFRVCDSKLNNELLSYIFNETNICLGQILDMSNSTTIEVLYSYSLKEIWMPVPPQKEQFEILEHIKKISQGFEKLISIKQQKIEKLVQYKKSIIYEYVTGKKEVQ